MHVNPYELTLREFLSIVFKAKWTLAGIFFVIFGSVFAWSYTIAPYYEATTQLLVGSGREFQVRPDPGQSIVSVPSDTKREIMNSEIQILTSTDVIRDVIKQVGLEKNYSGTKEDPATLVEVSDRAIQKFRGDLKATPIEQSNVIQVKYTNTNHDLAEQALKILVEVYEHKHTAMYSERRDVMLEQDTKKYQAQLDSINERLSDMKKSKSLFDVPAQRSKLIDERTALVSLVDQLQRRSSDSAAQIEALKSTHGQRQANASDSDPKVDASVPVNSRLLDLEINASRLFEQEIASRSKEVSKIDARLRVLEDGARIVDDLEREKHTLDELLHASRTRYEEARVNEQLDKQRIVSVRVIQPAYAPANRAGPRHSLFALAGLIMGAIGAAGMLVYLLIFRETLITVESVERIIGVPVLTSLRSR